MRILYHHRTRAEDAQGIHIEEIQRAFRQLGHEVCESAIIPRGGAAEEGAPRSGPGPIARAVSAAAAHLPPAGYEAAELASNAPETARVIAAARRFRAELVYARYSLHDAAPVIAGRALSIPVVLEVNAPLAAERAAHGGLAFPRLARALERRIWRAATAVVTVSGELARRIAAEGVLRDRILVLPNAVRREMLTAPRDGAAVRARLGIRPEEIVFGFTGWFRPWHGLEAFLDAFAATGLAGRARVLLVGDGAARASLEERVAKLALGDRVIFAGTVGRDAIADVIAAFDVAVQPAATPYASPMKIFEYLALGKPVVAASTPAIAEVLSEEIDSLLFTPGDGDGMKRALVRLASDDALRARLSSGARATITRRAMFWDENARRTLAHVARQPGAAGRLAPV